MKKGNCFPFWVIFVANIYVVFMKYKFFQVKYS